MMKEELAGKNRDGQALLRYKATDGQAALEMLIALAILVFAVSAAIMVTFGSQSSAVDTQTSGEAFSIARAAIENQRSLAKLDFNLVNPLGASNEDIYSKSVDVQMVDLFTKKVESIVTWSTGLKNQSVRLTTLFTNPSALGGGNTCGSVLSGDWTDPQKREYEFGADILGDTSSGFPVTSIQTFNKKMYVTVNNDNGNNDGTFFILDISDPNVKPPVLGQLDNSPAPNDISEGLSAVAVDGGDYAYVANAYDSSPQNCLDDDNCAQLQVIKLNCGPTVCNPEVVTNFKIQSVATGNKLAAGKSIFYKDGIVYLGLAKANGGDNELFAIDVGGGSAGGSPTGPVILDSEKIDNGVNSIFVKGNYVYVASPNDEELKIFKISGAGLLTQVGGFDAPGGGANNGNGKSMYLVGDKLYFGRTLLSGDELYVLNNSNPEMANLPTLGSKNILDGDDGQPPAPDNTTINGVIVRDYLGFLITKGEFQVWRVDNPTNITRYATPLILPPGSGNLQGTATDCEGNYIYVGSLGSNDKGYISIISGR